MYFNIYSKDETFRERLVVDLQLIGFEASNFNGYTRFDDDFIDQNPNYNIFVYTQDKEFDPGNHEGTGSPIVVWLTEENYLETLTAIYNASAAI
jgi:hypothetical protein